MNQTPYDPTSAAAPDDDHRFMAAALVEGRKALPSCLPNPPVGCVLVRGGDIVATGFTQPPWQPHAEAMALAALDGDAADVTAYVTLEPCAFHGRTPSCARALAARGVGRVVVAIVDPDPRNDGAGIAILRAAGIRVDIGVHASRAREELGAYLLQGRRGDAGAIPACCATEGAAAAA